MRSLLVLLIITIGQTNAQWYPGKYLGRPEPRSYPQATIIENKVPENKVPENKVKVIDPKTIDALDEVNSVRAKRGLPAYIKDDSLTIAAQQASIYRAANRIQGHTRNDFAYLPSGSSARAAGCAAWPPSLGWGACCTYDRYTYAGASYAYGSDGQRYMHLFVR